MLATTATATVPATAAATAATDVDVDAAATTGGPTPVTAALTPTEREVLYAVGCGMHDVEIAGALALSEAAVAGHLARVQRKLGLRDRAAAIVHAFDSGLVRPGRGPRRRAESGRTQRVLRGGADPAPGPELHISVLGPLRAWHAGQRLDLGPLRQQAVLASLVLGQGTVGRQELLDGVWGVEPPAGNVVPVYVYRLRRILRFDEGTDSVIRSERGGYRLARGAVDVDVVHMEELAAEAGAAARAGDLTEAVRWSGRALELFRGEPLAGLPGPAAELERLRLAERRTVLVQRRARWQLQLGRHAEATAELHALALAEPLNEPVAALLMHALCFSGRQAEALAVFDRIRRRLAGDLGVAPSQVLRRARRAVLQGSGAGRAAGVAA